MCKDRKDLTEDTKIMLEILRSSNTIEDALFKISRKLKFMHKLFNQIRNLDNESGKFAISLLRNLDPKYIENKSIKSIEHLL